MTSEREHCSLTWRHAAHDSCDGTGTAFLAHRKRIVSKFRCEHHIATVENITDCAAHLHEGRCGSCPYRTAKAAQKRCADYEPPHTETARVIRPRWIGQEDAHGCAIAALAMVTGSTYAEVNRWLVERMPEHDFAKRGITFYPQHDYLTEHGYCWQTRWGAFCHTRRVERGMPWPPEPWADVHLCSVSNVDGGHMVVLLRDGTVLDPLTPELRRLSDWGNARVNYVEAVWKVV